MMILGIYGRSNVGKTTLVEALLEAFASEYRVATIKHMPNERTIDREGTDTCRHGAAGAAVVVAGLKEETAFIYKQALSLDKIIAWLARYELVLVEGYKHADIPKIAVGDIEKLPGTIFRYEDNLDEIIAYVRRELERERAQRVQKISTGD